METAGSRVFTPEPDGVVASLWPNRRSVFVLETDHPRGPVGRLHPAGFGPRPMCVERFAPLQRPELFERHLSDGPVGEEDELGPAVSVDAEPLHFVSVVFNADEIPGKISRTIRVLTDLGGGTQSEITTSVTIAFPLTGIAGP